MLRPDRLGLALRFLRTRHKLRQRDVAERAGITGSMLSGYENGKKLPTLASLDKILLAMGCGLRDLVDALERTVPQGSSGAGPEPPPAGSGAFDSRAWIGDAETARGGSPPPLPRLRFDLQVIFGPSAQLGSEEGRAFHEMLQSYCRWLRYLRESSQGAEAEDLAGPSAPPGA